MQETRLIPGNGGMESLVSLRPIPSSAVRVPTDKIGINLQNLSLITISDWLRGGRSACRHLDRTQGDTQLRGLADVPQLSTLNRLASPRSISAPHYVILV